MTERRWRNMRITGELFLDMLRPLRVTDGQMRCWRTMGLPDDTKVIAACFDFERSEWLVRIESESFAIVQEGSAIPLHTDILFTETHVREITIEESVVWCSCRFESEVPCDGYLIHVGWTADWKKLHACHNHHKLVERMIVHPIHGKDGGFNLPPDIGAALQKELDRQESFPDAPDVVLNAGQQ